MKARIIGAALLAAVFAVAATTATGATKRSTASITVWLQVDAQSGWPGARRCGERRVPEAAPRRHRQRPVPDLAARISASSTPRSPAATRPTSSRWATPR